jgi:hypothetical protein
MSYIESMQIIKGNLYRIRYDTGWNYTVHVSGAHGRWIKVKKGSKAYKRAIFVNWLDHSVTYC